MRKDIDIKPFCDRVDAKDKNIYSCLDVVPCPYSISFCIREDGELKEIYDPKTLSEFLKAFSKLKIGYFINNSKKEIKECIELFLAIHKPIVGNKINFSRFYMECGYILNKKVKQAENIKLTLIHAREKVYTMFTEKYNQYKEQNKN